MEELHLKKTEIDGIQIEEGQSVVTLIGAANRDPEKFEDPDNFLVRRDEGPPLSFASGIHYCLGANLSKSRRSRNVRRPDSKVFHNSASR